MDTEQFVRDSLSGDAVSAQTSFNDLMRSKISARIEALRQVTAASLFSDEAEEGEPVEDEASDD